MPALTLHDDMEELISSLPEEGNLRENMRIDLIRYQREILRRSKCTPDELRSVMRARIIDNLQSAGILVPVDDEIN